MPACPLIKWDAFCKAGSHVHMKTVIQASIHVFKLNSCQQVQDAQVAMKLYMLHRKQWERQLKETKFKNFKTGQSDKHAVARQIR